MSALSILCKTVVKYTCAIKKKRKRINFLNEKNYIKIVYLLQVSKIDRDR